MVNWTHGVIGDYCNILNGYAFKSEDYIKTGGVLNFRVVNMNWDGTVNVDSDCKYLPSTFMESYSEYLLHEGDILFVMVGATRGKLVQIPGRILPALMNQNMWRIVPQKAGLNNKYLFYFLRKTVEDLLKESEDQARGFLKKSDFRALKLLLPPLPEQRRIAAVLSLIQQAIEQQERMIALTMELKKALMHKLFTEGTRGEPQKQTEIGPVPESWEVARLEDLTESFTYGTSVKCDYDRVGFPVLRIPNVVGGQVDASDLKYGTPKPNEHEALKLLVGDLLFVRTNGVQQNAGRCSMYCGELGDHCYFASYLIRARLNQSVLMPEFINEYVSTPCGASFLAGKANRTADGKYNINTGTLKDILVPVPILDEQQEMAESLSRVDRTCEIRLAFRNGLEQLFRTLLHQLMTAQIRVNDMDLSELGLEIEEETPQGDRHGKKAGALS